MGQAEAEAWIAAYEQAWRTIGTEPLRDLFTEDASYRMSPYEEPAVGLARIGELWERERQGSDEEFGVTHQIVAVEADTAVVRVVVQYGPRTGANTAISGSCALRPTVAVVSSRSGPSGPARKSLPKKACDRAL